MSPASYLNDLDAIADVYRNYRHLMAHWKHTLDIPILDVAYEDVVNDPEQMSRKIVSFVGLDWHDDCLKFHSSKRVVHTPSRDQVSKPVYTSSVARHEHFEQHLTELAESLSEYL